VIAVSGNVPEKRLNKRLSRTLPFSYLKKISTNCGINVEIP
jgi:hypothetical protein